MLKVIFTKYINISNFINDKLLLVSIALIEAYKR